MPAAIASGRREHAAVAGTSRERASWVVVSLVVVVVAVVVVVVAVTVAWASIWEGGGQVGWETVQHGWARRHVCGSRHDIVGLLGYRDCAHDEGEEKGEESEVGREVHFGCLASLAMFA
jgi:hypothetical protein